MWLEIEAGNTIAEFVENDWEVALKSHQGGAILRPRSGSMTRTTQCAPSVCSMQDLEALESKLFSKGSWDWTGESLQWRPSARKGISLTMRTDVSGTVFDVVLSNVDMEGMDSALAQEQSKRKRKLQELEDESDTSSRPPLPKAKRCHSSPCAQPSCSVCTLPVCVCPVRMSSSARYVFMQPPA